MHKLAYQIVNRPLLTEKSDALREASNQYVFEVHKQATKHEVRRAVEELFGVHVVGIRTENVLGKVKRMGRFSGKRADWKKAYVTLKEGENIELFEGV